MTYDANGFYGHPDHIQAHRVSVAGARADRPGGEVLRHRDAALGAGGGGRAAGRLLVRPQRRPVGQRPRRPGHDRDRRDPLPARQAGRDEARTRPRSPSTASSTRSRTRSGRRALGTEYYTLLAGSAASGGRRPLGRGTVPSATCSRGNLQAHGDLAAARVTTGLGYLALFVLGLAQGLIGSFQYGRSPVPLIAILLILILFATCVLAAAGGCAPTRPASSRPSAGSSPRSSSRCRGRTAA